MLRSLSIENFRAFRRFHMAGLGRINLCVGTNNCGKTSILEAISILVANGSADALLRALARRGEYWADNSQSNNRRGEFDIRHVFHGHELAENSFFSVSGTNDFHSQQLAARLIERQAGDFSEASKNQASVFDEASAVNVDSTFQDVAKNLGLELRWEGSVASVRQLQITPRGGIVNEMGLFIRPRDDSALLTKFITTEALRREEVIALFDAIVLTPEENSVIEALRTIEPSLERIAPISSDKRGMIDSGRGGLVVKLSGSPQRIPIGSMGDGIWRLLGIALSLVSARGGILLVDEIDTGLHYSVMADMWRMVRETAARLDVQVFATTHSRDCVESLAAISRAGVSSDSEVTIQRIERGIDTAVAFAERDIVIAAQRHIEVR
jgi:energy-coupling factor transporter ATP-binding protein EcfA2